MEVLQRFAHVIFSRLPLRSRTAQAILVAALALFAAVPAWIWLAAPQLTKIPPDFSYESTVISLDDLYDEGKRRFAGEKRSVTIFHYEVTARAHGVLTVKNVFDVRSLTGEKIFAVERLYGIEPTTGKHVAGAGDRDREGYLFAPRRLKRGQPFTYWHINYDGPARMAFAAEESLFGLSVYRYESRYQGVRIDQTKNLGHLPGVPHARGVVLDPHLQLWIEPVTGRLIKYADQTTAWYYDIKNGARLHPWNKFSNTYAQASVLEQVNLAKRDKPLAALVDWVAPLLLAIVGLCLLALLPAVAASEKRAALT